MTYGDYVALLAWELGPEKTGAGERGLAQERFARMAALPLTAEGRAGLEALFHEKVMAVRDALPAAGRFPVLICAPGQGYPAFDNSVMAEYLASHGFIVLSSPSFGPDGRDMPDSALAIDAGARDMEYLLAYAQTLPNADPDRIAALGFSLGGSSSALFALRNARVRALVSLDGVLRDDRYLEMLSAFPQFEPERLRGGLLWISCGPTNSLPGFAEGSFPERARHAEVVRAVFPGLLHHDFSSMSSLQRRRAQVATRDWSLATASYEAASRLIRAFLESQLKGLERTLDQEPGAVCKVTTRPAQAAPPTATDFREALASEGFASASALIRIVERDFPKVVASFEEPLVVEGYEALGAGRNELAIEIFTLTVTTFPTSIDGWYGLGKANLAQGVLEKAEIGYRAARNRVEKSPDIPAEQKAGILGRIDQTLAEIAEKKAAR